METSDERQYLITPLFGHQKTDEYIKDSVNQKPRQSIVIMFQWCEQKCCESISSTRRGRGQTPTKSKEKYIWSDENTRF